MSRPDNSPSAPTESDSPPAAADLPARRCAARGRGGLRWPGASGSRAGSPRRGRRPRATADATGGPRLERGHWHCQRHAGPGPASASEPHHARCTLSPPFNPPLNTKPGAKRPTFFSARRPPSPPNEHWGRRRVGAGTSLTNPGTMPGPERATPQPPCRGPGRALARLLTIAGRGTGAAGAGPRRDTQGPPRRRPGRWTHHRRRRYHELKTGGPERDAIPRSTGQSWH